VGAQHAVADRRDKPYDAAGRRLDRQSDRGAAAKDAQVLLRGYLTPPTGKETTESVRGEPLGGVAEDDPGEGAGGILRQGNPTGTYRFHADDVPPAVGHQCSLARVEQDQAVVPGVDDDRAPADRDRERGEQDRSPRGGEGTDGLIHGRDEEVGFQFRTLGLKHEFGITLRQPQPGGGRGAPDERVAEAVAVEREPGVQIGDGYLNTVDLQDEGHVYARLCHIHGCQALA